jgi:hypothetical protein
MTNDVIGWLVRERRGGTVGAMAVTLIVAFGAGWCWRDHEGVGC